MTASNANHATSATWFTGLTFSSLAIPLALFGSQTLDVSLGGAKVKGQFDDYAMHYLGAAAVVSLGLGASRLAKSSKEAQESVSDSTSILLASPSVESLMIPEESASSLLTESSLRASGLQAFLDEDDTPLILEPALLASPAAEASLVEEPVLHRVGESSAPSVAQAEVSRRGTPHQHNGDSAQHSPDVETLANVVAEVQSIVQQMASQSENVSAVRATVTSSAPQFVSPSIEPAVTVASLPLSERHTTPIFPAAQSYASFSRAQSVAQQPVGRDLTAELAVLDHIYQIREQMQNLMNQVDLIQADLEQTTYPAQRLVPLRAAQAPSYTVSAVEPVRAETAQAADVWSNHRAIA